VAKEKKSTENLDHLPKFGQMGGAGKRFNPGEKPKNMKWTLKRLLQLFGKYRKSIAMAGILTLGASAMMLVAPLLIGRAINTYEIGNQSVDVTLLHRILMILILSYVLVWILQTLNGVLMAKVTQRLVKDLRETFFRKLQRIPLSFHDQRAHGDTMSRMTNDVITSALPSPRPQRNSSVLSSPS